MSGELQNGDNQYARATATASSQAHADEQSLLILARGGDGAAYAELYRRNAKKVYHVVFRMTKNREDTEDVLQEALMKAFIHLGGFEGRSAFSSWLTRIAINGVLMMRRKRRSHHESSIEGVGGSDEIQIRDETPDSEQQMLRRERVYRVRRSIQKLPPILRVPLQHQLAEDLPLKDLASRLGISVPATKSRLLRARSLVGQAVVRARISGARPDLQKTSDFGIGVRE